MSSARTFQFSTAHNPQVHPIDAMRQIWGPVVQVRSLDGGTPQFQGRGIALPGVTVSALRFSPTEVFKPAGADNDDITLTLTLPGRAGGAWFKSKTMEQWAAGGAAIVKQADYESTSAIDSELEWLAVRISKATLGPLLDRTVDLQLKRVPGELPAVALLRHYLAGVLAAGGELSGMEGLVAGHVRDLAALIIGASRDGEQEALAGGMAAARLQAARQLIADHLLDPNLSEATVAGRMRISPSYVRKLFVAEGGFYAYVSRQRIAHAYRLLTHPAHAHLKVIDVAFQCGFSSLKSFNRRFRMQHGLSPSEARQAWAGRARERGCA